MNFVIEAVEFEPSQRVVARTSGDLDARWSALLSSREGGVHVDLIYEVTVLRPDPAPAGAVVEAGLRWNRRRTTPRGEKGLRKYLAQKRANDRNPPDRRPRAGSGNSDSSVSGFPA